MLIRALMTSIAFLIAVMPIIGMAATPKLVSVYTTTDPKKCVTMSSSDDDKEGEDQGDYFEGECPGYGSYRIIVTGGDLRYHIDIEHDGIRTSLRSALDQVSGEFPSLANNTLEWRIAVTDKLVVPYALIYRIGAKDPGNGKKKEVLVVVKLDGVDSCVFGSVKATGNPKADSEAKALADKARTTACEKK